MTDYDLHITGGTIVDGTRVPRYHGDIWIKDGKIAQLGGRADGLADQVIDAAGKIADGAPVQETLDAAVDNIDADIERNNGYRASE